MNNSFMNKNQPFSDQGYMISTNQQLLNISFIHSYLSEQSYWAQNVPLEIVEPAIRHSLCFGLYWQQEQIGFARVITDKATFAYLADVFITDVHRGKGLSKWLLEVIHRHPQLQALRRWLLVTRDAHGLYEQFLWQGIPETAQGLFMQIHQPAIYQSGKASV